MSRYREGYLTLNSSCTWRAIMAKFSLCKMTLTKWKFGHEGLTSAWGLYFFLHTQYQSCNMCISDPLLARGEHNILPDWYCITTRSRQDPPSNLKTCMWIMIECFLRFRAVGQIGPDWCVFSPRPPRPQWPLPRAPWPPHPPWQLGP